MPGPVAKRRSSQQAQVYGTSDAATRVRLSYGPPGRGVTATRYPVDGRSVRGRGNREFVCDNGVFSNRRQRANIQLRCYTVPPERETTRFLIFVKLTNNKTLSYRNCQVLHGVHSYATVDQTITVTVHNRVLEIKFYRVHS